MSFLTYFANGHANVGTPTGPVADLRMCNPLNANSLAGFVRELLRFPNPLAVVPMTGHDTPLFGAELDGSDLEFGGGADGNLGRVGLLFYHVRPNNQPMFHKVERQGGAYLITRVPREWLYNQAGHVRGDLLGWLGASDEVRATMPLPLVLNRIQGVVWLCIALVRGESRPVSALNPETRRKMSADDIAGAWFLETGLPLNTTDVQALTDAAIALGWTLVPKADVPLIDGCGDTWKAMHAAVKSYACGLGTPCVPAIVDTTDGMLVHPITRALLAVLTVAMRSWGWPVLKLQRCALTAPFVDPGWN